MELKEYQTRTLDTFARWLDALAEAEQTSEQGSRALEQAGVDVPQELRNYPHTAWKRLAVAGGVAPTAGRYVNRTDDAGRPIPHVCFKLPTGGGKTLLAAAALERLSRQVGLTLWITPTRAIYEQTKAALKSREHPYRQILERASAGRVMLLEKDDHFTKADTANYLCVMMLMLPAANRQKGKEFLRMFRDSGRYPTLFPDGDDAFGDTRLLFDHPDLERMPGEGPVKHSLFNVFKMLRPVVVLDEAHKAYGRRHQAGKEFARSVNRLNPRLVIELSATPNRGISNLLVDIGGTELKAEEMIKLPVKVTAFSNVSWQDTLLAAHEELERLSAEAESLHAHEGRSIRPIAVVRVERTGKDQRDGERVHAEDVRDYLIQNLGIASDAVAVKSSERNELAGADLLSEYCPIRWIVTKAALMEGWDCPFAYMLVMLDNTTAKRAITQLVGRVMRQPHARLTGREALDQCYVYCWNTAVGEAVEYVKLGLETEGLTGLSGEIRSDAAENMRPVEVRRRKSFRDRDIFLPLVLHRNGTNWRELDYMRDILPEIDWEGIAAPAVGDSQAQTAVRQSATVDIEDNATTVHEDQKLSIDKTVKLSWFARRLADIVPNPWQAARIGHDLIIALRRSGETDDNIYDRRSHIMHELRKSVSEVIDKQAHAVFVEKLQSKEIRFDLRAGLPAYRIAKQYEISVPEDGAIMAGEDYRPLQLSLFEPIYTHQFDTSLERRFARYLDEQKALRWWHRIAARQGGEYYLRGWKQNRVWPDFVAIAGSENSRQQLLIFETKGAHLDGSDTQYKKFLLDALQTAFEYGSMSVHDGPARGVFKLVFDEAEFPAALASLKDSPASPD